MKTIPSWKDALTRPKNGHHIVQTYQDLPFLAEAVSFFTGGGFRRNEGVIIIATQTHWKAFSQQLRQDGFLVKSAMDRGQLLYFDADDTLSKFMVNGMPDWSLFQDLMSGILDGLRKKYPVIRAYGEMVNILWQNDRMDAAIRLEDHWNRLSEERDFSLFCAYQMDNLDHESYKGALQSVCRAHSHFIPAQDYPRFEEAVTMASQEAMGQSLTNILRFMAEKSNPNVHMPNGQATLLWLQKNMPYTAERVILQANARYKKTAF